MRNEKVLTVATSLYHSFLFLYPAALRNEFGREMVLIFRDSSHSEQDRRGTAGLFVLWIALFWDLVSTALTERVKEVSAMSTSRVDRIAGLSGILAGLAWVVLAVAVAATKAHSDFWPRLAILAPALMLVVTVVLYRQGNHNTVGTVALAVLAIGSAALVVSAFLWAIDAQHPKHTASLYLIYLGTFLQGLGLAAAGYAFRSLSDFTGWSTAIMVLGVFLILGIIYLFLDTDSVRITWRTTNLIVSSVVYWILLGAQAITWMIVGTIAFTGSSGSIERPTHLTG